MCGQRPTVRCRIHRNRPLIPLRSARQGQTVARPHLVEPNSGIILAYGRSRIEHGAPRGGRPGGPHRVPCCPQTTHTKKKSQSAQGHKNLVKESSQHHTQHWRNKKEAGQWRSVLKEKSLNSSYICNKYIHHYNWHHQADTFKYHQRAKRKEKSASNLSRTPNHSDDSNDPHRKTAN